MPSWVFSRAFLNCYSDRQLTELPQALVDHGFGEETAQETNLACLVSSGVAPAWYCSRRGLYNYICDNLGCIATLYQLPHQRFHALAYGIIDGKQPIGPRDIFFERGAGHAWFDQRDANSECAQFMVKRL